MQSERPPFPDTTNLDVKQRRHVMDQYYAAVNAWNLECAGYARLGHYKPGAVRWCTSCLDIIDRLDSYGDCADCGEEVWWVTK